MTTLTESLDIALHSKDRVQIMYKCGSVHKGRIYRINGSYYVAFNTRSLVCTKVATDRIYSIRYNNSGVYIFKALGRKSLQ